MNVWKEFKLLDQSYCQVADKLVLWLWDEFGVKHRHVRWFAVMLLLGDGLFATYAQQQHIGWGTWLVTALLGAWFAFDDWGYQSNGPLLNHVLLLHYRHQPFPSAIRWVFTGMTVYHAVEFLLQREAPWSFIDQIVTVTFLLLIVSLPPLEPRNPRRVLTLVPIRA